MFERDYILRLIAELGAAMRRSMERTAELDRTPDDSAKLLEAAIGNATDFDGVTLLSLAPESIAQILQVSGADPRVTEYMARSLLLCARYYEEDGNTALADLRAQQARAIAVAYGHDLPDDVATDDAVLSFLASDEADG